MFSSDLETMSIWKPVLRHPVILESLAWLQMYATTVETDDYSFGVPSWYVNIHGYQTLPEAECCWENHIHTIDIQYLISGCEGIRWTTVDRLGSPLCYREEKDRQEFDHPNGLNSLVVMQPGMFAIFMPGEAHCPKISLGEPNLLRKAVVKIPVRLLGK